MSEPESNPVDTDADDSSPEIVIRPERAVPLPALPESTPNVELTLAEPWPGRVRAGVPLVEFADLQVPEDWVDGTVVALREGEADRVGTGLVDRAAGGLRLYPTEVDETFDEGYVRRKVDAAVSLRRRLRLTGPNSAYRLINGEGDGLAGFLVDVYAGHAVIHVYSTALLPYTRWIANAVRDRLHTASIIAKVRPDESGQSGRLEYTILEGDPPAEVQVVEDDIRYEIHLLGGVNTGLFCDMRDVRRAFARYVSAQRVLNLFCYTGSFSLVAAMGKAKQVTSVDFAGGVLQWAKKNVTLNGLDPAAAPFEWKRDDVFEFLKTSRRGGGKRDAGWDVIVLDPPTATAVPGRRWFLKSDYDRLIGHALRVLNPGGFLVVAANSFQSRPERLENQIRSAARDSGRRLRLLESYGLPPDFPTQMVWPQHRYLKVMFLQAES